MAQLKNCHLALTSSLCIGYDQYVMDHGSPVRHTSYASQVNFYLQHQSQPPVSLFEMKFQRYRNVLAMETQLKELLAWNITFHIQGKLPRLMQL